jgi:hypothetical protein
VTELDIGDVVRASQVSTPEGVELLFDRDFDVIEVEGKLAPEVEAAPAAPAAGAAAPATPAAT